MERMRRFMLVMMCVAAAGALAIAAWVAPSSASGMDQARVKLPSTHFGAETQRPFMDSRR